MNGNSTSPDFRELQTFVDAIQAATSEKQIYELSSQLANSIHTGYSPSPTRKKDKSTLTKREAQCLCLAAEGKNITDISTRLKITEHTTKFHQRNAIKKLKAKNKSHAIALALVKGCIVPDFQE